MVFSLSAMFDSFIHAIGKFYDRVDSFFEVKGRKKYIWGIVIFICFGILLFLNVLTPMIADDYGYLYVFGEKRLVSSLSDLIQSQTNHYYKWGGRSVVHFIAQAILQLPYYVVDILNSMVYLLFAALIYLHIKGHEKKQSLSLFVLINLALWFVIPKFGDTILWVTGSANYLWGTTILLLFLLPYRLYKGSRQSAARQVVVSILMFAFGIIAGWTNENSVAGMIVIILLLFIYYRSQKWKMSASYILGLLGVLIGYAIMIAAPGNFARGGDATQLSFLTVLYRFLSHTQSLVLNYGYLIISYLFCSILYWRFTKNKKEFQVSLIYLLGAVAAIYAMVLSPQFPPRAWFGLITYTIIAIGILLHQLNYQERFLRQMRATLLIVGCLAFLFSFQLASKDVYRMHKIDLERKAKVEEAIKNGADECVFELNQPLTDYVHEEDINGNHLLPYYYGIHIEYKH